MHNIGKYCLATFAFVLPSITAFGQEPESASLPESNFNYEIPTQDLQVSSRTLSRMIKALKEHKDYLNNSIKQLDSDIKEKKEQIEAAKANMFNLEEYLKEIEALTDVDAEEVKKTVNMDERAEAYLLICDMLTSLQNPYDESTNKEYIKKAPKYKKYVLKKHQKEYDALVNNVNEYYFYILELGRVFDAAKDKSYKGKSAATIAEAEDAPYLLEVPYTERMLVKYINSINGKKENILTDKDKRDLYEASPDAFPDFKSKDKIE